MEFKNLLPAEFVWRDNRFVAAVRVDGSLSHAHIANTGRLTGLLESGRRVWLADAGNPNRQTRYDLKLVENNDVLVSVDTRIPNTLFGEAVCNMTLAGFLFENVQQEVQLGSSRIDFRLSGTDGICWVETKSVTLVRDKVALFPDAPTSRGKKHLLELARVIKEGVRSCVVFFVQRPDADVFKPNWEIDPEFAELLVQVNIAGVEVRSYLCEVNYEAISIKKEIPVNLNPRSEIFHV